jgi:hypothetical protein
MKRNAICVQKCTQQMCGAWAVPSAEVQSEYAVCFHLAVQERHQEIPDDESNSWVS